MADPTWRCTLELEFGDAPRARAVHEALAPDNAPYVRARVEGSRIVAEAAAKTPMSLLHTIEDYLACVAVAEKAVDAARE